MYDKSHYSFLIAFDRQLAAAVARQDRVHELADLCESISRSLGVLLAGAGDDPGDDDGGDDEGGADGDAAFGGPALGDTDELRARRDAMVDSTRRRVGGGAQLRERELDDGGIVHRPPVLTRPKTQRKGTRRGAKK